MNANLVEVIKGEIAHNITPVIGWLRWDAKLGKADTDKSHLNAYRERLQKAAEEIAALVTKETDKPAAAVEPEYEWGVKYRSVFGGDLDATTETIWGYDTDPRTSGVIDEEGDIEIKSYYHPVISVGKRIKSPEVWEDIKQ